MSNGQNTKPTKEDANRKDEYNGKFKNPRDSASEEEKFGMSQNPVRETPTPMKNLKAVGG